MPLSVTSCYGNSVPQYRPRPRKAPLSRWLEVPLRETNCDEHIEHEHRRIRCDNRSRERGSPREHTEPDESARRSGLVEASTPGQHAIDPFGLAELRVGNGGFLPVGGQSPDPDFDQLHQQFHPLANVPRGAGRVHRYRLQYRVRWRSEISDTRTVFTAMSGIGLAIGFGIARRSSDPGGSRE